jgi:DNA-binding response OmpR family regulator
MGIKILVADDDLNICQLLNLYLSKEGYIVDIVNNGLDAVNKLKDKNFDLVILDVMMPVMDGMEALREIRKFSKTPVILLTAKSEAMDKITGLDIGADDYVTKPPEWQELISRIKAILRRMTTEVMNKDLSVGNLFISISNYKVKLDDVSVEMTPKEIELLYFLATHPNIVYTREQLLEQLWNKESDKDSKKFEGDVRTVDVHVKRIREKLGGDEAMDRDRVWSIKTVWGVGYKFGIQ